MANFRLPKTGKRGRQPSNLSVRLFLLDPEKEITKVTKETCSKKGIEQLMQKGYGPPQPDHCTNNDRVEFSLELTNEQFKQKLVEIYPQLENACFVFMKAGKDNMLGDLNPGTCCFRCYTPENVYHSERGQGRLYIQKIAEDEISQCTHGESRFKRLCAVPGFGPQRFVPIQPKLPPAVSTITAVGTDLSKNVVASVAMPARDQLPVSGIPRIESMMLLLTPAAVPAPGLSSAPLVHSSGNKVTQNQLPAPLPTVSQAASSHPVHNAVNIVPQLQTPSTIAFQTASTQLVHSSGEHVTQNQLPATSAIVSQTASRPAAQNPVSGTESSQPVNNTVNVVTQNQLPAPSATVSQTESNQSVYSSGNMVTQNQQSTTTAIVSRTASIPAAQRRVNSVSQSPLPTSSNIVSQTETSQPVRSSGNLVTQNQLPALTGVVSQSTITQILVDMVTQSQLPIPTSSNAMNASTPFHSSGNMVTSNQLPISTSLVSGNTPTPPFQISGKTVTRSQIPTTTLSELWPLVSNIDGMTTHSASPSPSVLMTVPTTTMVPSGLPMSVSASSSTFGSTAVTPQASFYTGSPSYNVQSLVEPNADMLQANFNGGVSNATRDELLNEPDELFQAPSNRLGDVNLQTLLTNLLISLQDSNMVSNSVSTTSNALENPSANYQNQSLLPYFSASPSYGGSSQSLGLHALAEACTVERGPIREGLMFNTRDGTTPLMQGNVNIAQSQLQIDAFLENVKSTQTLEISLALLNNNDLLKELNASTINIHTVEIQSSCEVQKVLSHYSLPSCLKVLRINNNNLNFEDIVALIRSLSSVNGLHELYLSGTKFKESSFTSFLRVLISCSNLRKLCLIDNGLTKQEIDFLIPAFKSMENLENLNLSKSNLTETQASHILQKQREVKSIRSLDLSQNALQGNKIIIGICQLQSLEDLNLSHNHIRFFPLPDLENQRDSLPINTKIVSLSSNHMMPIDICRFCSLIRSDLLKLYLDFNHVGRSIGSLFSLRIEHLKVLSLANADICGPAVGCLEFLLSLVGELEELNLSSNNLILKDFRDLQSPLSNLTQLKKLNLSNNPEGISIVLHKILPSLKYLEELRLSNVHLNGDDLRKICDSIASLKDLKYIDLSMNASGPDGTNALANILKGFPFLEGLDMSISCIKEDDISVLCKGLVPLQKFKYLNLSGNKIDIEVVGDALFLPSTLEELILSDVIHGGKLFANLRSLQHLRKLDLSNMKLRPCDVEALADVLPSFAFLEELVLVDIVCADYEKIFRAVKSLKNIKKINFRGIKIHNGNVISEMLSSLLFLEELVLAKMHVGDRGYEIILSAIKMLRDLRKLDLGQVSINNEKTLFDTLTSLSFLEELVFPYVTLNNADDMTGWHAVGKLTYIKKLELGCATITKPGAEALAKALPSLHLLEKLVLGEIVFDNASEKQLFTAVGKLTYLKKLDLRSTTITQPGADDLAKVLPSLQLLEKLMLGEIVFDNASEKQLFTAVGKLTYLKKLNLLYTKITQTGAEALAKALPSLQLLEKLVLGEIVFDNASEKQLFTAVGKLTYLKKLNLWDITITQPGAEALAKALPSLQLLEKLVLQEIDFEFDNASEKQLFTAVGKLTYLKKLNLCYTKITQPGTEALAKALPSLQLLEKLILGVIESDNASEKQLFTAVGNLKYLKVLDRKGT